MTTKAPLSRRTLLAISAAAAAGTTAVPLAALADVNPDVELLRLDQEHDITLAHANEPKLEDDELTKRCEICNDLEFAIHAIPAQGLAGLAVKARLASHYFNPEPEDPLMQGIVASLVEDILRMANISPKPSICLPYPAIYSQHSSEEGQSHG